MKGLLAPITAYVERRPARGALPVTRTPSMRNVRPVEQFSRHQSPDAPRQGDTPARPSRMPIAVALAIAPYHAVMADDFWLATVAPTKRAKNLLGPGSQLPWAERANIERRNAEAYGSLVTLDPVDPYNSAPFLK